MAQTSENLTLKIYGRNGLGKNESYRIRKNSMVPAVVYGPKLKTPYAVALSPKEVRALYLKSGRTGLVSLEMGEGAPADLNGTKVLFKEIQTHPLKNTILHVDLHQLDLERKIRVTVPLSFVGKAKGLAEGGIMSILQRQVEIKCLPTDIPNHVDVDVSDLAVNDSIHVEELAKRIETDKLEFIYDANFAIVAVLPPEAEKAAEVAPAAAAAPGAAAPAAAAGAASGAAATPAPAAPGAKK